MEWWNFDWSRSTNPTVRELERSIPPLPDVPSVEEEDEADSAASEDSVDEIYRDPESIGEQ